MEDIITVHVSIKGRVQGVGYRDWTLKEATKLGLSGWVRNRIDETVEACFTGSRAQVEDMIEKCHAGPSLARVASVSILYEEQRSETEKKFFPADNSVKEFIVLRTA